MLAAEEERRAGQRRRVRLAMTAFFGAMLAFTLFANTYRHMTLPKVQVERPELGSLSFTLEGEGFAEPIREVEVYDRTGWTVIEVLAEEDAVVAKGDPLLRLDAEPARRDLEDERDRLAKFELQMEELQEQYKRFAREEDEERRLAAERDIKQLEYDIRMQRRAVARLEERIAEEGTLYAPVDGKVLDVAAKEGLPNGQGQPAVVLADAADGWGLDVTVDADLASYVAIGQTVVMEIVGETYRTTDATLIDIEDAEAAQEEERKRLRFRFPDGALAGGERIRFQWTTDGGRRPGLLVPNEAVAEDGDGPYVYVVDETKTPLGNEFTARKAYVQTGDADETSTLVTGGLRPDDNVVTEASEPLNDGDRVRL